MTGSNVVVIGAGVTGLSTAWWLARSGVSVTVLDKGVVGWEASSRNGGGLRITTARCFTRNNGCGR